MCSNLKYLTHQHFRRATEIAQRDRTDGLVGTSHVIEAHNEMFCSPKVDLRELALLEFPA